MNVFGMGPMEVLLIVVLALIVFGPARLPEIMGQVGKAIADFRRATSELSDEFNKTIQAELQETRAVVNDAKSTVTDLHSTVTDIHSSVSSAVTGTPAPVRTAEPAPVQALPPAVPPVAPVSPASGELHTDNGTNGTVVAMTPLADTAQWSWETTAPPEPGSSPAPPSAEASSPAESPASAEPPAPEPRQAPPASPSAHERAARDELLPPY